MIYLFFVYILICLYKISFKNIKSENKDCLSIESTTMINGIFVIMIIFSHFNQYVTYTNELDLFYVGILKIIGQLMVTTFFFYSGYGIYESIKKKGDDYIKGFMKHRFLKVFLSFFLAIICFLIMNLILNHDYSWKDYLLAFTGLVSVGNSNWFIFATFILYIITYLTFRYFKKDNLSNILMVIIGIFIYIIVMNRLGYSSTWYNTVLCYGAGMLLSYFKDSILNTLKDNTRYIIIFILNIIVLGVAYISGSNVFSYIIGAILFCNLIFLFTYKIKIGNKILFFFGKNTFCIYILQRIPMTVLQNMISNPYLYFIASITTTIIFAYLFNKLLNFIFKKIRIA